MPVALPSTPCRTSNARDVILKPIIASIAGRVKRLVLRLVGYSSPSGFGGKNNWRRVARILQCKPVPAFKMMTYGDVVHSVRCGVGLVVRRRIWTLR